MGCVIRCVRWGLRGSLELGFVGFYFKKSGKWLKDIRGMMGYILSFRRIFLVVDCE